MSILQHKASDPANSIWVSASAGTGKTKILTDRVLRLLLSGVGFSKILCLTFTNAAAGEMKERIIGAMYDWSIMTMKDCENSLKNLLKKNCTPDQIKFAKNLYNLYLRSEEEIKINTIHSFCQKILKQFPIEANVPPNFKIIDDIQISKILKEAQFKIFTDPKNEILHKYIGTNYHELILQEILNDIITNKAKFKNYFSIHKNLINIDELAAEFDDLDEELKVELQLILKDKDIRNLIGADINLDKLKIFFLTQSGEARKKLLPKNFTKNKILEEKLYEYQKLFIEIDQKNKLKKLNFESKLIITLAAELLEIYEDYKLNNGYLDYDDLIVKTSKLLTNSYAQDWILYKLDGFIDHLLVDEAQDTSFDQWVIINAILEEFYSGESSNKNLRTIFIVGDDKQSIFSFQGADVKSFDKMNKFLQQKMKESNNNFHNIELDISYRSTKEILDVVTHVFQQLKKNNIEYFTPKLNILDAFRTSNNGCVELWPLVINAKEEEEFWPILTSETALDNCKEILANNIALYIKKMIDDKVILPSTNNFAKPGDFMILFRTRDEFTKIVIEYLQKYDLPVSGLDRIILKENLSVIDLLSMAKFVLNPEDDLILATILKSPIIKLSEEQIYNLITKKDKKSLWEILVSDIKYSHCADELNKIIEIYKNNDYINFFQHLADILGYRKILNEVNGPDSDEAINELIYSYFNFIKNEGNYLQEFIYWVDNNVSSIKKESDMVDKIRIMTVHASKGLQAPIVIMCDTTRLPNINENFFWDGNNFFINQPRALSPELLNKIKLNEKEKILSEYFRLLYVGMTRAEDKLIICGYENNKTAHENCWYNLIRNTMETIGSEDNFGNIKYGQLNQTLIVKPLNKNIITENIKVNEQNNFSQILKKKDKFFLHPSKQTNLADYGIIIHKILEDSIKSGQPLLMIKHPLIASLEKKDKNRIFNSLNKIITNDEFIALTNYPHDTELSLGIIDENNQTLSVRIDLIIYKDNEILIIDYKSDNNPNLEENELPVNYVNQLKLYKNILQKLHPGKKITAKILWLELGILTAEI